jgi:hypothetical protein
MILPGHIFGIPVEETLLNFGPAIGVVLAAAAWRARGLMRRLRARSRHRLQARTDQTRL